MSGRADALGMEIVVTGGQEVCDTTLTDEAQRYLAVVEFFRAQGCEPHWRPERPQNRPVTQQVPDRRKSCSN